MYKIIASILIPLSIVVSCWLYINNCKNTIKNRDDTIKNLEVKIKELKSQIEINELENNFIRRYYDIENVDDNYTIVNFDKL